MGGMRHANRISAAALRRALLDWYDAGHRELPWRSARDPYAIWVSEVMLQQTQAARVAEYWPRFMAAFPTASVLAGARADDVLAAWSGLGYYRRARMLHEAAALVVARGGLPRTASELRDLPGMGEYTAAAVASIAFGEAVPVLDGNAVRVFGRLLALKESHPTAARVRELRELAERLIDPARPGDWNQAVMELGAVVCLPPAPRCSVCPIARSCGARRSGAPASYARPRRSAGTVRFAEAAAVIVRNGRVLMVPGPGAQGWWGGLWMLPRVAVTGAADAPALLAEAVRREFGPVCEFDGRPAPFRYSVTRHRVDGFAYRAVKVRGAVRRGSGARWLVLGEAVAAGMPAPDRRVLSGIIDAARAPGRGAARVPLTPRARRRTRAAPRATRRS